MQVNNVSLNQNFGVKFSKPLENLLYNGAVKTFPDGISIRGKESVGSQSWNDFQKDIAKLKKIAPDTTMFVKTNITDLNGETRLCRNIYILNSNGKPERISTTAIDYCEEDAINIDELDKIVDDLQYWNKQRKTEHYKKAHKAALELIG